MVVMVSHGCYGITWLLWYHVVVMVSHGCYGVRCIEICLGHSSIPCFLAPSRLKSVLCSTPLIYIFPVSDVLPES